MCPLEAGSFTGPLKKWRAHTLKDPELRHSPRQYCWHPQQHPVLVTSCNSASVALDDNWMIGWGNFNIAWCMCVDLVWMMIRHLLSSCICCHTRYFKNCKHIVLTKTLEGPYRTPCSQWSSPANLLHRELILPSVSNFGQWGTWRNWKWGISALFDITKDMDCKGRTFSQSRGQVYVKGKW